MRKPRRLPLVEIDDAIPIVERSEPPPECGCEFPFEYATSNRHCDIHKELLRQVLERWNAGTRWERDSLWQEADGLGRRGYTPPGGRYDVAAVSQSSPSSVERMHRVLMGMGPLDDGHPPLNSRKKRST